ncbi:MAG: 2-keto-4-pentenoate hydratase [Acidobacteriaceae bacterium]
MMNGTREQQLIQAANLLLDARRTHTPIPDLPVELRPTSVEETYIVHDAIALAYGEVGGYKVGAATADATPSFAPMPRTWMASSGALLAGPAYRYRVVESEVAFLVGRDLPPRATPYTRAEVIAAMASCHPVIEELETGLLDPRTATSFSALADLQTHGSFVYGPAVADWQHIDFSRETVTLTIDGRVIAERTGSNTSGDLVRLLPYLANEGAARTGGLKAGQWITTGNWTGVTFAPSGSQVEVNFAHLGRVSLRFA